MFKSSFLTYISQDNEDSILFADSGAKFSMIIEMHEIETNEEEAEKNRWLEIFSQILSTINTLHINNLVHFEEVIYQNFKEKNVPMGVSAAFAYLKNDTVLYLKTMGNASLYLKRGRDFACIIQGDKSASGLIKENDYFSLVTQFFLDSINGENELKKYSNENVNPKSGQKGVAIVLKFTKEMPETHDYQEIKKPVSNAKKILFLPNLNIFARIKGLTAFVKSKQQQAPGKKKTVTLAIVIFISLILIWSVGFGVKRRIETAQKAEIVKVKESIVQKLNQADDVSYLNMARAQSLIAESHEEFVKLKQDLKNAQAEEIKNLEEYIKKREGEILKMDEKKPEEFFDLTVDNKDAKGSRLYLYGGTLAILNNDGIIYLLSIPKKSLDKKVFAEIKKAQNVAYYEGKIFFYNVGEGIYKIEDEKIAKVVDNDTEWGKIVDFEVYNGNLYLLDQTKNDIYKYLVADSGFSVKKSYFGQGESTALESPNSVAIDQSIYIGSNKNIQKFTAGVRNDFTTSFPDDNYSIDKVYTSKEIDKVIVWDKNKGTIYIMTKSGSYEKQIVSSVLKKASDITAFGNDIYILYGPKIYKISL